ncbi:hypothetical protein [Streptomyces sp. NPDC001450]
MDAGLAAVLGALAGSVATIGAAFATGWATREQAKIAARSEHRRQRIEPRHDVYREFLTAVAALEEHTSELRTDSDLVPPGVRLGPDVDSAFLERTNQLAAEVKAIWLRVALIGPERVAEEAATSEAACSSLASGIELMSYRNLFPPSEARAQARRSYEGLGESLRHFMRVARSALEDDGIYENEWERFHVVQLRNSNTAQQPDTSIS